MQMTTLLKAVLAVTLCAFIVGCATTSSESDMHKGWDPWIGQNIDSLIAKRGTPGKVSHPSDDQYTVYSWFYVNGSKVSFARYIAANMFAAHRISIFESEDYYCRMDWAVDKEGRIINWQHEGQCLVIK